MRKALLPFVLLLLFLGISSRALEENPTKPEDQIVYVTKTGTKYHKGTCRYLSKSMIPIALKDAVLKYEACKVCAPPVLSEKKETK